MIKMAIILLIALILRVYGINWDQGYHLHPDERMLIMVTEKLSFFKNLNPEFFNYGSLPIYLLRLASPNGNYDGLLLSGRILSVAFDLLTIIFIYKICLLLSSTSGNDKLRAQSRSFALLSSFLYSIAFFPIQNSHFFVVDVFLTTFTTILIYLLLLSLRVQRSNLKLITLIGITFAAMLATKFTAIIFYPVIIGVIIYSSSLVKKNEFTNSSRLASLARTVPDLITFHLSFFTFHFLFMPYAYLDFQKFFADIRLQLQMNSNPYIFPYTLQYVETTPYFYYLKNIFLWGLGPIISTLSMIGFLSLGKFLILNFKFLFKSKFLNSKHLIIFLFFYLLYFFIVGRSSVKFMRYMLPMYPFFAILAGYGLYSVLSSLRRQGSSLKISKLIVWIPAYAGMTGALILTFMFISIYSKPHTRIAATEWILKNIPAGSTLAIEHWDDRIPIYEGEKYNYEELTLYDQPDDDSKWQILNDKLAKSDYIVIASNRLYVPLQKLSDCKKYKSCYSKTAEYYKRLFSGQLAFKKIAEFSASPLFIDDQSADESFTVYDHPKIFIFKKNEKSP